MPVKRKTPVKRKAPLKRKAAVKRKAPVKKRAPKTDHEAVMQTLDQGKVAMIVPAPVSAPAPTSIPAVPSAPMPSGLQFQRQATNFEKSLSGTKLKSLSNVPLGPACMDGYSWDTGRKVCRKDNFSLTPFVKPTTCQPGYVWDAPLAKCKSICAAGQIYDSKTNMCKALTTAVNGVATAIANSPGATPNANSIANAPNAAISSSLKSLLAGAQIEVAKKTEQAGNLVAAGQTKKAEAVMGQVSNIMNSPSSSSRESGRPDVRSMVAKLNQAATIVKHEPGASPVADSIVATPNTVLAQEIDKLSPAKQEKVAELTEKAKNASTSKQAEKSYLTKAVELIIGNPETYGVPSQHIVTPKLKSIPMYNTATSSGFVKPVYGQPVNFIESQIAKKLDEDRPRYVEAEYSRPNVASIVKDLNQVATIVKKEPGPTPVANSIVATPNVEIAKELDQLPAGTQQKVRQLTEEAKNASTTEKAEEKLGVIGTILEYAKKLDDYDDKEHHQIAEDLNQAAKTANKETGPTPAAKSIVATPNVVLAQKIAELTPAKQEKIIELTNQAHNAITTQEAEKKLNTATNLINSAPSKTTAQDNQSRRQSKQQYKPRNKNSFIGP